MIILYYLRWGTYWSIDRHYNCKWCDVLLCFVLFVNTISIRMCVLHAYSSSIPASNAHSNSFCKTFINRSLTNQRFFEQKFLHHKIKVKPVQSLSETWSHALRKLYTYITTIALLDASGQLCTYIKTILHIHQQNHTWMKTSVYMSQDSSIQDNSIQTSRQQYTCISTTVHIHQDIVYKHQDYSTDTAGQLSTYIRSIVYMHQDNNILTSRQ